MMDATRKRPALIAQSLACAKLLANQSFSCTSRRTKGESLDPCNWQFEHAENHLRVRGVIRKYSRKLTLRLELESSVGNSRIDCMPDEDAVEPLRLWLQGIRCC